MTTNEVWETITSQPKWYAGLRTRNGSFYTAQSANWLKNQFKKKALSPKTIENILNQYGYVKKEIEWIKKTTL